MEEKKTSREVFPYFVVKHITAVYERQPCKEGLNRAELFEDIRSFAKNTKKHACVVFGKEDAIYVDPDGIYEVSKEPPSGGELF